MRVFPAIAITFSIFTGLSFGQNEALFNEKIAPLLKANCAACHGSASPAGRLSMASLNSLLTGGKHGPALEPGDSKQSLLMQYVRGERTPKMPMGGSLPDETRRLAGRRDRPACRPCRRRRRKWIRIWTGCCTSRRLRRFRQ